MVKFYPYEKTIFFLFCLSTIATYAQVQVRGNVSDNQGEPIPGVTILLKGTQQGVITDLDGNYSISVADLNRFYSFHSSEWKHKSWLLAISQSLMW